MSKARLVDWRAVTAEPVVLISGAEDFFASSSIREIREQLKRVDEALEIHEIEANEYASGQLLNLTSPSLFAEPRLIIIRSVERCSDELIEDVISYLEEPTSDTCVVLRHNSSSVRGKKMLDAIRLREFAIEVSCLPITKDAERLAFVQAEFARADRKITQGAARALLEAFAGDIAELASACDQLLQDSAESITEQIVERYYGGRVETNAFKVVDSALAGRSSESLALLRHALSSGADPVPIVAAVSMKIRQLAKIYGNRSASAQSLGMAPWQVDKARKDVSGWSEEGLARTIQVLADTDAAVKGAERDPVYSLEKLVHLIAKKGQL
jgi:DNA polymerase-3 subunit delta